MCLAGSIGNVKRRKLFNYSMLLHISSGLEVFLSIHFTGQIVLQGELSLDSEK